MGGLLSLRDFTGLDHAKIEALAAQKLALHETSLDVKVIYYND